jgi:predicted GNAT family acetyltransferase
MGPMLDIIAKGKLASLFKDNTVVNQLYQRQQNERCYLC